MEGLDALLEEERLKRDASLKPRPTPSVAAVSTPLPPLPPSLERTTTQEHDHAYRALKAYLERLLDPDALDAIDCQLREDEYEAFEAYLQGKPDLIAYTLNMELERMQYSVTTAAGVMLASVADIRAEHARGTSEEEDILWRAANQALFADLLRPVQRAWFDAQLSVSVCATKCSFELHLGVPCRLEARATLNIQTLGAGDEPLLLATCEAVVAVEPSKRARRMSLEKPRLARAVVYEEQLLATADALVRWGCFSVESNAPGASAEQPTLDDVANSLEQFMRSDVAEEDGCAARDRGADSGFIRGLLGSWRT